MAWTCRNNLGFGDFWYRAMDVNESQQPPHLPISWTPTPSSLPSSWEREIYKGEWDDQAMDGQNWEEGGGSFAYHSSWKRGEDSSSRRCEAARRVAALPLVRAMDDSRQRGGLSQTTNLPRAQNRPPQPRNRLAVEAYPAEACWRTAKKAGRGCCIVSSSCCCSLLLATDKVLRLCFTMQTCFFFICVLYLIDSTILNMAPWTKLHRSLRDRLTH
jgi:hypothetical protein